jgi:Na+-translocating ferredoxin:NAD+ oxidoreductase RnfE subunit
METLIVIITLKYNANDLLLTKTNGILVDCSYINNYSCGNADSYGPKKEEVYVQLIDVMGSGSGSNCINDIISGVCKTYFKG